MMTLEGRRPGECGGGTLASVQGILSSSPAIRRGNDVIAGQVRAHGPGATSPRRQSQAFATLISLRVPEWMDWAILVCLFCKLQ